MIKQLTEFLDYGIYAEIALAIFTLVFIAVVWRTLITSNDETTRQANIVLGDPKEKRS